MLYVLCFAAVTLTSAGNSKQSSPASNSNRIAAQKLNDLLEYDDYYEAEKLSHICQFAGDSSTTTATFLTLVRTQCRKQQTKTNYFSCVKTEKRKYLHCALIERSTKQGASQPLGYICERGLRHQQSPFFDLNRNCSSLLYDSSKDAVQVKLPHEDQPWKENLPLYMPVDCKWNSSAKRIISRGAKEPSEDKRPKNPLGRQGVSGRGKFQHLGENAFVLPVIVRRVGDQLQVVVQENSQAPFSIPLPWIPYPSYFYEDPVGRNLTRYLHKMWLDAYEDSGHFEYFMSVEQEIIYAGPIRHKHNTDNAWLSIRFSVIDDSKYEFMSEFPSFSEFYWRNITEQELTHIKQHYVDVKEQTLL